jgi:transcriptional regulator with XRE-family HTH domain
MDIPHTPEFFRGLVLRHRRRTGLTQREFAARVGVSIQTVQEWEGGLTFPTTPRLQQLVRVVLEAGGLLAGREQHEARQLWTAAAREAPRKHAPFDEAWFVDLLAASGAAATDSATQEFHRVRAAQSAPRTTPHQDWGEAPDTTSFVGRGEELALLQQWLVNERCRLIAVLGFGGIGKTTLAARLAQSASPEFDRVYWRGVHTARPVSDWLAGALAFLSAQPPKSPGSESEGVKALVQVLRARRCLLVLDNFESLLEPGQPQGSYRAGMDGYGRLLQAVGETAHQSCLVLTSREAPPDLVLGGAVRGLELHGLATDDAQALLSDKRLVGDAQAWGSLVYRYGGNGLALKIVGEAVRRVYDGDLAGFLGATADSGTVFGGVRSLLDSQLQGLSQTEHDILTRLAVEHEPIALAALVSDMAPSVGRGAVIDAIETLRRRSLVERSERGGTFTLQSMVLEYVADWRGEAAANELDTIQPANLAGQWPAAELPNERGRHTPDYVLELPDLPVRRPMLLGRGSECAHLDSLLADIRVGQSRSLLLRGQAGIGKTALLEYLVESASDVFVARAAGAESEMELTFASLQQLCGPMLNRLEKLPAPQRQALEIVFGLSTGPLPDQFHVGLGVLSLFSEVARERPVLCVVDNAQWLDHASALTLAFVARRLLGEPIGLLFAAREPSHELAQISTLEMRGLPTVGGMSG